jgi:hypothetical protein
VDDLVKSQLHEGSHHVNAPGELPPSDTAFDEEVAHLRQPPKSTESEQGVLGALLFDAASLAKVSDILATRDFYARSHKVRLRHDRHDGAATASGSTRRQRLRAAGPRQRRRRRWPGLPAPAHAGHAQRGNVRRYAEIVVERSNLREIISLADQAATRAFKNEPAADILADAKAVLGRLAEERKLGAAGVPLLTLSELREQSHAVSLAGQARDARRRRRHAVRRIGHVQVVPGRRPGRPHRARAELAGPAHEAGRRALHRRRGRHGAVGPLLRLAQGAPACTTRSAPITVVPVAIDLTQDARRVVDAAKAKGVKPRWSSSTR